MPEHDGEIQPGDKCKALSLWQPWASLIAIGAKTIETRSWSTTYRGPLAIHAAKRPPRASDFGDSIPARAGWIGRYNLGFWTEHVQHAARCDCDFDEENVGERCMAASHPQHALLRDAGAHGFSLATTLPLGAVVATCTLVDVVPMIGPGEFGVAGAYLRVDDEHLWLGVDPTAGFVDHQRPYGDFAPGRFAWLLDDMKPIEPVPTKGRQGLWTVNLTTAVSGREGTR